MSVLIDCVFRGEYYAKYVGEEILTESPYKKCATISPGVENKLIKALSTTCLEIERPFKAWKHIYFDVEA